LNEATRLFLNAPLAFGWGSLAHLSNLEGKRAAVVTDDAAMQEQGFLDQALSYLQEAGMQTLIAARIAHEPDTAELDIAIPALQDFQPDWIVALGGGSVIDSAKALRLFCELPLLNWEEAFVFNGLPPMHRTRLVAIPSSSGTGSETSRVSVIVQSDTGMKRLIFSPELIPTLAILDPALTMTMPPKLVAASAFDALSHAIESSIAVIATEFTVSMALGAIRLIFKHLPASYHHVNPKAREQIHYAATLSGIGINNSTAGLAHAMDQVGPLFNLPHGVVCAILQPYTMAFSFKVASYRFAEMGQALGLPGKDEDQLGRAFLHQLVALQREVDLPLTFQQAGVPETEYLQNLITLVEAALVSGSTRLSPLIPSADEVRELFLQAYYGVSLTDILS
jgi:alcohol dehydrogenase class IV